MSGVCSGAVSSEKFMSLPSMVQGNGIVRDSRATSSQQQQPAASASTSQQPAAAAADVHCFCSV
eukprot:2163594-Lingulodinium_polyedra.AAC.1